MNTSSFSDSYQLESDDQSLQFEKLTCFYLYKKYIKEIYIRMKQFKDELLASCLEFLLSLPKELISFNLHEAFESLQVINCKKGFIWIKKMIFIKTFYLRFKFWKKITIQKL